MRKLLRRVMPNSNWIREHRLLGWLGPKLHHPRVWHVSREGIAMGMAIGLFFGVLIPIGQIPVAAAAAIALRANLPMAVAGTFVTNPFTFAPIYYLAYRLGVLLTGVEQPLAVAPTPLDTDIHEVTQWFYYWRTHILRVGKPLIVGLCVIASTSAVLSYFLINGLWRLLTVRAWQRRTALRKEDPSAQTPNS